MAKGSQLDEVPSESDHTDIKHVMGIILNETIAYVTF